MDTLLSLRAFLAASRYGSFSEAARQMHVVPSVIAKRVSDLERTMQTRLFNRSTRQVSLTEAGHKFHVHANALVIEFDSVIGSMKRQGDVLQGHLRIKMPTTLTVLYLANVLTAFQREYNQVTMEVVLADRSVNPIEEGYDVVVTGLAESYEGVSDLSLCPLDQLVCASPSYFETRPRPKHPSDLADHDCLVFRPKGPSWQFESPRGPIAVDVPQKLVANDNSMLFAAACAGNGIAVLPTYLAKDAVEDGRLESLLVEFPLRATWLKALVPKRRQQLPHVAALAEWLRAHLENAPPWEQG